MNSTLRSAAMFIILTQESAPYAMRKYAYDHSTYKFGTTSSKEPSAIAIVESRLSDIAAVSTVIVFEVQFASCP
jgi:hypothetical protein